MTKKIIFLLWRDKVGGIEVIIPRICKEMKKYDLKVFVFRSKNNKENSIFDFSEIQKYYGSQNNFILYLKLFLFLRKNKESVFHGFNMGPFILIIMRLAGIKKIIYSIHGTVYWKNYSQRMIRKFFWNFAITKNIKFYSNSEFSKSVFLDKISKKTKIKVIYNPFDTERFKIDESSYYVNKNLKICFLGRLSINKNLFQWIDTAEEILAHYPRYEFHIYGNGPLKKSLLNYIKNKRLENKVILFGFRKDVENIYKKNDLLLFLSQYESFGNVVVESILCGIPVIASRIPSMEEIFANYPQFLVPLNKNLTDEVIKKIINFKKLKEKTFDAANEFKNKFSLEKHIKELETIYTRYE